MHRNTKTTWIAALAIGLLATAAATSAGAFGRRGGPPGLARLEHRVERLDLGTDTRAKAFAIIDAARGPDRALREKMRAAHEALRATIESGAPDTAALDKQIDAMSALQAEHHKQFLHTLLQIGKLLPADKRAQWMAPAHRGGRHGHGAQWERTESPPR
jgi:Spy/CpxP family protein refolding chaperone